MDRPGKIYRPFPREGGARIRNKRVSVVAPPSILTQHASVIPEDGPVFRILFPVAGSVENAVLFIENANKPVTLTLKLDAGDDSFDMTTEVKQGANKLSKGILIQKAGTRLEIWMDGKAAGLWLGATFHSTLANRDVQAVTVE